jgi:hypothetical protein
MAAAGLWTTPSDLARAGIAMQRALAGDGAGSLTPATAAAMLTPSPASEGIGLGFFLEGKGAGQRFGHGGWDEGFVAQMCFYRDRGQGAVVMVNSNEGAPLMGEILRAVAREYAWAEYFSPSPAADPATGALDEYTGVYATRSLDCSVAGAGGQLWFTIGQQPAIELQPVSRDVFRAVGVNAEVVFNRVEEVVKSLVVFNRVEKVVKSLTLTQDGTGTMAERR